ncbi:MAG: transcriptional repressor LexA [Subdoligranulum variabile]|nr:transcriptional repressor LexA [Subdoligranulum variabile]
MSDKVATFAQRLREGLDIRQMNQTELAKRSQISKSSISRYIKGDWEGKQGAVYALAKALGVTEAWLMGYDVPMEAEEAPSPIPAGFEPLPEMTTIPLVGSIACGTPILAEQNIEARIGVPALWRADFALTCHGNSMAAMIQDGDIVCIRKQPEVENGEIAAVRIGEEATLKRFYRQGDTVMLQAENPAFSPLVYTRDQLNEITIEGLVVGICRGI